MNDFINKYRIKHIRVSRDYDRINYGYNHTASFYNDREEIVEMEIPRSGFEELVNIDRKIHSWVQEERDEEYLRRQYPALKESYDKYKMLMELYR
jgi:hypothetical protein